LGRAAADYLLKRMQEPSFRDWWLSPREYAKVEAIRRKRAAKDRAREVERAAQQGGAAMTASKES
jgi:hypothetical protein